MQKELKNIVDGIASYSMLIEKANVATAESIMQEQQVLMSRNLALKRTVDELMENRRMYASLIYILML